MKVVAFNGSARKEGNTAILINKVFAELAAAGIETEIIPMAGKNLRGCTACYKCAANRDRHCAVTSDDLNLYLEKMLEADAVILGSPVYFADMSANMKALIERAGMVALANDYMLARKLGAAVVAVRRGGAIHTFDALNHFFFINQMIVPGSSYWNEGIGRNIGEVENDSEGLNTMINLGRNMAWLLKKIHA